MLDVFQLDVGFFHSFLGSKLSFAQILFTENELVVGFLLM